MTLRELIQRALDIASQGLGPLDRAALETAVEPILPIVFGEVGDFYASREHTRSLLRRTKDLVVANGVVQLSDDVLTRYICDAVLYDPTDTTKRYSLVPWESLVRESLDDRLGYFAVEGEATLHVVEPYEEFDPTVGPDVALKLSVPCALEIPALDTNIDMPAEVTDELLRRLVNALRPVSK